MDRATLANWRTPPFNRWAFHHVRELIPTAEIRNDSTKVRAFPSAPVDVVERKFLDETATDAMVVLHRGKKVFEYYAGGMDAETPHILMSVSKSMLGLLAGILASEKALDVDKPVTHYVPEVEPTAYRGASVRHLLDMRTGIEWDENYLATSGPIVEYRQATGWNPTEKPSDLLSFYQKLKAGRAHGGKTDYISPNTDLLGIVVERATKRRYADLMSEFLWKPVGAATPAYVTVDRLGAARAAGGMCVTAEDLARVGQALVEGRVVPPSWVDDIETQGSREAWAAGTLAPYFEGLPITYRSKWYVLNEAPKLAFGFGIHGQNLFVDRKNAIVIAKLSSQPQPMDAKLIAGAVRTAARICAALTRP